MNEMKISADKLRDMARALREKAERSDDPQARIDDLARAQEYEQLACLLKNMSSWHGS